VQEPEIWGGAGGMATPAPSLYTNLDYEVQAPPTPPPPKKNYCPYLHWGERAFTIYIPKTFTGGEGGNIINIAKRHSAPLVLKTCSGPIIPPS
jgi:hypothetical protein